VLGGKAGAFDSRAIPRAVFAEPELAAVGLTEGEAQAAGIEVSIGRFPLAALGRAVIESATAGFAKLIFAKPMGTASLVMSSALWPCPMFGPYWA